MDLLQHEVLVAALLRLERIPGDPLDGRLALAALRVLDDDLVARRDGHLPVGEEDDVARVDEHRRDVRGDEVLALADADDEGGAQPRGDDLARIRGRDDGERVDPAEPRQRGAHGLLERAPVHVLLDQVGDDLGIGLGDERVSLGEQLALELEEVLDDAVVDDDDLAVAVAVRVGVLVGGTAVGRPARVADPERSRHGLAREDLLEVLELARAAADVEVAVAHDGDPGRVVAAVLELSEALDEDLRHGLGADVSDDAAHVRDPFRNERGATIRIAADRAPADGPARWKLWPPGSGRKRGALRSRGPK